MNPSPKNLSALFRPVILIPALNAAATLPALLTELKRVSLVPILVVDDGSQDATAKFARECGAHCLVHQKNRGKGAALASGFRWALDHGFSHAVTIDADSQHNLSDLGQFLNVAPEIDIVLGTRTFAAPMPWQRRLSNTLTSLVISICTGRVIADSQCGYRRYRLLTISSWPLTARRFSYESEILFGAGRARASLQSVSVATTYGDIPTSIRGGREIRDFLFQFWKYLWR